VQSTFNNFVHFKCLYFLREHFCWVSLPNLNIIRSLIANFKFEIKIQDNSLIVIIPNCQLYFHSIQIRACIQGNEGFLNKKDWDYVLSLPYKKGVMEVINKQ
jgi:hypothetical protein